MKLKDNTISIKPRTIKSHQMNRLINLTSALALLILSSITSFAQHGAGCVSDELNNELLQNNMEFSRSFQYMEMRLRQQQSLAPSSRTNDVYTLPVVVHVIHNGEAYGTGVNITDEQIQSAISALNNDFRHVVGTNGDGNGPDVGIEFCLASRNPQGQPTTGIVRVNGSAVPLYATQGIESSGGNGAVEETVKALSTWPRESYVNIWIVNEIGNNDGGSGIQGYAYFPFNNAVDGIVVLYNAFGTVGNLKSYTNMNRTLTHEVGHYLGLFHTFNGTTSCSSETDCTNQGDRVCDTPATIQATSCSNPACAGTQQVENYMDYTSQTCQDMFTEGQKLRMRTTLESQRTSMITSLGCMPVYTNDVGITAVLGPSGTNCPGALTPQVTLTNFGSSTLTNVTIRSNVDGAGMTNFNWTGSLVSGASATINLATITPASGDHTFYAWTFNPNGITDQNNSNDQSTGTFSVAGGSAATLDVITDYYGAETTWVINDNSNNALMSGGPYANGQQGVHHYTSVCLPTGCYTLVLTDAYGDGQGFTNGSFNLTNASGTVLASGAGNWGETSTNNFCITAATPAGPVASFTIQDQSVCRNAQVDFTSTSTNAPTSYLWTFEGGVPATSTEANPQNITWPAAGNYDVTLTVTNAGGTNTYTYANAITIFSNPSVTITGTNPLCAGASNGVLTSSIVGNGPYSYTWSNGATTANLNNAAAGTYTVAVVDANGCSAPGSATLTNPTALTINGTVTNALCNGGNTGSVAVTATGGTGNKTYSWNTGSTSANLNNASAGNYTVTVTDANGCSANQSFTITQPSAIALNVTTTAITCNNSNNGALNASATGGTGNKTYTWNTGAIGASISSLAAGSYTVTATDANACTAIQTTTLVAPTAIQINGSETDLLCAGNTNGSVSVSANGGTGAISLLWNNGSSNASMNNLTAGVYTVTASDANNCTAQMSYTINAPAAITVSVQDFDIACNDFVGSAQAVVIGGVAPYNYNWSNGSTGSSVANLQEGAYSVNITDANGCQANTANFDITSTPHLSVFIQSTDITCSGMNDGSATVSVNGGDQNYTFTWGQGETGNTLNNLTAGEYSVNVVDGAGCMGIATTSIAEPTALAVTENITNIDCFGNQNGSIELNVTGGRAPYAIQWNTGATASTINNAAAGTYQVNVADNSGCALHREIVISQPNELGLSISSVSSETCIGNDGSASIAMQGGTAPYTIAWNNGNMDQVIESAAAGAYVVAVQDAHGCFTQMNVNIGYECTVLLPTTQLTGADCGATNVSIHGQLTCDALSNATAYIWRINDASGFFVTDIETNGNTLSIDDIAGAQYGKTYVIGIRAQIDGSLGTYGNYCEITIEELPTSAIADASCGTTIQNWGDAIEAVELNDAQSYEWIITGNGITVTEFTSGFQLPIALEMGLINGVTYEIQVRAKMLNGEFTAWSDACSFTIADQLFASVEEVDAAIGLTTYPNPCDGQSIHFVWSGSEQTAPTQLNIFGMNGQLIETAQVNPMASTTYTFQHTLASGIYVISYEIESNLHQVKFVVR